MTAIESVLRSGRRDVMIVVSDNSSKSDERDRLEEFCARLPASAVKYVRPPNELTMPAHWEWLWHTIRNAVAPSHVAYLTDRLVFVAGALTQLMEIVDRHPDQVVSYHWDYVKDTETPVELVQTQWTGRLLELDARRLLELSSRGQFGNYLPRLMTCIAPVGTVAQIERRFGDVFGSIAPDYRFAYRCLALCDTILYLDRACLIEHGMRRSAGAGYRHGTLNEDARDFAHRLADPRFGHTPVPEFETVANAMFQEYCGVRAEFGGDRFPRPQRGHYLAANAASIARIADPRWRARMRDLLRDHGWTRTSSARYALALAGEIAGYFLRHPGALGRSVKRQLVDRPPGTPAEYLLPRAGLNPPIRDDLTFETSAEAIAHAEAHPRPRTPYAWHVHRLQRAGAVVRSVG